MIVGSNFSHFLTVNKKFNSIYIGISLNLCSFFHAVMISASAKMNKRISSPPCFINVVSIFFHFSIKGNESLVILSRVSCLISSCCSKLKHIPYVRAPDIRTGRQHFQHMLVILGLIAFCEISFFRFGRLKLNGGICTVLCQSNYHIGMLFMEVIKPLIIVLRFPYIPSVVKVVTSNIRKLHQR